MRSTVADVSAAAGATAATPAVATSTDELLRLLVLQSIQQHTQPQIGARTYAAANAPLPALAQPTQTVAAASRPAAEVIKLPRPITLLEFCERYSISEKDRTKLELLEVELGDRECELLPEKVWKGDAGFSELGWGRFVTKHAQFCADITSGHWN